MHRNTRGLIAFFGTAVAVVVVAAWAGYKSYMAPLPKTEDTFQVCLADAPERCPQQPTVFLNCTEIKDIPSWAKTKCRGEYIASHTSQGSGGTCGYTLATVKCMADQ